MKNTKNIDNLKKNTQSCVSEYPSKWTNAFICHECEGINTFDGSFITCSECGSRSGGFKSIRYVYDSKWPFIRNLLRKEIK